MPMTSSSSRRKFISGIWQETSVPEYHNMTNNWIRETTCVIYIRIYYKPSKHQ